MFAPTVLLSCVLLMQGAAEGPHRFEYPDQHYSIELPTGWTEVGPAAREKLSSMVSQLFAAGTTFQYDHIFVPGDGPEAGTRFVFVLSKAAQIANSALANLESIQQVMNEATRKLTDSSGGLVQGGRIEDLSYDKERHVLYSEIRVRSPFAGELRGLMGMYVTRTAVVQVQCQVRAAEFEAFRPVCKQIIDSLAIDPKVAILPPVPRAELMAMPAEQAYTTYRDLVARVKGGDLAVDFRALRFACIRSGHCDPHGKSEDLGAMNEAGREHRYTDLAVTAQRLLDQGFTNLDAHIGFVDMYKQLGKDELAKFHFDVITGFMRSILDSGDGNSKETAFEVVHPRERWWLLATKMLPYSGDGVSVEQLAEGGHHYERWQVPNPKTHTTVTVFFNTDAYAAK